MSWRRLGGSGDELKSEEGKSSSLTHTLTHTHTHRSSPDYEQALITHSIAIHSFPPAVYLFSSGTLCAAQALTNFPTLWWHVKALAWGSPSRARLIPHCLLGPFQHALSNAAICYSTDGRTFPRSLFRPCLPTDPSLQLVGPCQARSSRCIHPQRSADANSKGATEPQTLNLAKH
jgi:hypothetical protein